MAGPFKMKGSPMQRNFGISPMKSDPWKGKDSGSYEKHKATTPHHGGKPENYQSLKESGEWDKFGKKEE